MFVVTEVTSEENRIVCYGCLIKNLKDYKMVKTFRQTIIDCELCNK